MLGRSSHSAPRDCQRQRLTVFRKAPASTEGQTTSSTTVTGETGGSNPSTSVTEEGLNTTSSSVLGDSGRSNPSTSATEEGLNTTSSSVLGGSGASAPSASTTGGQTAGSTAPGDDLGASDPSTTATGGQTAGSSAAVGDAGASDPSTGSSVIESQKPIQEHQGADKPIDEPIGGQKDAVKESKDAGEKAMAKRDPNDHSGEPMHVHDDSEKKEEKTTGDDSGKSMEDKAKEQGTGEHWVKTSGMAAEGGDFDATKPGAGREAERESFIPCTVCCNRRALEQADVPEHLADLCLPF